MARKPKKLNISKLIKEGRGTINGDKYKSWLTVRNVPSLGRRTRLNGIESKRQHVFFSDNERNYFYLLEYSDCVLDIREQFPLLPLEDTLIIAKELGIEHSRDPKTGEYIVMTTDFFITKAENGEKINLARTVKSKNDLMDRRVLEKFEIERIYWTRKEVNWAIVTELEINKIAAENISSFHTYYGIQAIDTFVGMDETEVIDLILEYTRRVIDLTQSVRHISTVFEKDMLLAKGTGISIFKHLLARKIIKIDLTAPIDIDKKMNITLVENALKKEFNIS